MGWYIPMDISIGRSAGIQGRGGLEWTSFSQWTLTLTHSTILGLRVSILTANWRMKKLSGSQHPSLDEERVLVHHWRRWWRKEIFPMNIYACFKLRCAPPLNSFLLLSTYFDLMRSFLHQSWPQVLLKFLKIVRQISNYAHSILLKQQSNTEGGERRYSWRTDVLWGGNCIWLLGWPLLGCLYRSHW